MNYKTYVELIADLYSVANGRCRGEFLDGYLNVDWHAYFSSLGNNYLTPLVDSLHRRAGINELIGEEERLFLNTLHSANVQRNQAIVAQYSQLLALFQQQAIPVLPLKGLALLIDPAYPDPGARLLIDIDILVQPRDLTRAVNLLLENGYEQEANQYAIEGAGDYRNMPEFVGHHTPKLIKPNTEAPVEIHLALDSPMLRSRHDRLLAFAWSSAYALNDHASYDQSGTLCSSDIFQALHCVYSSLVKDCGSILGTVDFRHLEDYAYLRQKIESNEQVSQLNVTADSLGLRSSLDYYQYQYRHFLLSEPNPPKESIVLKIKAIYIAHVHKYPFVVSTVFRAVQAARYVRHLFSLKSLKRQFGPLPLRKAIWLRVLHVSKKTGEGVKASISRALH